jgi:hypothetical protein
LADFPNGIAKVVIIFDSARKILIFLKNFDSSRFYANPTKNARRIEMKYVPLHSKKPISVFK